MEEMGSSSYSLSIPSRSSRSWKASTLSFAPRGMMMARTMEGGISNGIRENRRSQRLTIAAATVVATMGTGPIRPISCVDCTPSRK